MSRSPCEHLFSCSGRLCGQGWQNCLVMRPLEHKQLGGSQTVGFCPQGNSEQTKHGETVRSISGLWGSGH